MNVNGVPRAGAFYRTTQWVTCHVDEYSGVYHTVIDVVDPLLGQQGRVVRIRP